MMFHIRKCSRLYPAPLSLGGLLRQQDSNTPAPYVLDVRRAAATLAVRTWH